MKQCLGCSAIVEEDLEVCPHCGYKFKYVSKPEPTYTPNFPPNPIPVDEALEDFEEETIAEEVSGAKNMPPLSPRMQPRDTVHSGAPSGGGASQVKSVEEGSSKRKAPAPQAEKEGEEGSTVTRISGRLQSLGKGLGGSLQKLSRLRKGHAQEEGGDTQERPGQRASLILRQRVIVSIIAFVAVIALVVLLRNLLDKKKEDPVPPVEAEVETGELTEGVEATGEEEGTPELVVPTPSLTTFMPASEEITQVITTYFTAMDASDVEGARSVMSTLGVGEESAILDTKYDHFSVEEVYSRQGMTEDSMVVYVVYNYQYSGIDIPIPSSSYLYLTKDGDGSWKIDSQAASDPEVASFMQSMWGDDDVTALVAEVRQKYEAAIKEHPELLDILRDSTISTALVVAADGDRIRALDNVNIRQTPDAHGTLIGALEAGDVVVKEGRDGDWIIITYEGQTAYVYGEYFEAIE